MGDLACEQGVQPSLYRAPMDALVELRLVEVVPATPGERRRWHRAVAHPLWPLLHPVLEHVAADAFTSGN